MPTYDAIQSAITISLIIVVTLCAITDILEHRIPNIILLPALMLAFVLNSWLAGLPGLLASILGLALGMAALFPMYSLGGTSAGDVKLLGVVGALLGTKGALIAIVATLFFGGALGIVFIVWRVIEPILVTHIAQVVRSSEPTSPPVIGTMNRNAFRRAEFPYAPAIACATYYSLWHLGYFSQVMG